MANRIENINVENAEIMFKNFSGKATKVSPKGVRGFSLVLSHEDAERLANDGWNIRYLEPYEEGDPTTPILDVRVRLDEDAYIPAEIYLIQNGFKHRLYEDSIHMLDEMTFENIDLVIRPYYWKMNGKSGIKAYLQEFYASGITNTITSKYLDVPLAED